MTEADRLARWHEILKDPIRQKILLKLGQYDKLSFDELMKDLKIDDQMRLYNELQILHDLVTKAKDENYQFQQEFGSEDISERYMLTEEGHDVVDWMIAFPVLADGKLKPRGGVFEVLLIVFVMIVITILIYFVLVALGFHLDSSHSYYSLRLIGLIS
jgi:hypothetical protein